MSSPVPPSSRASFSLVSERARARALLLHGYTSSPWELRPIGDALTAANIDAVAPLLPGHGTKPRDIDDIDEDDWLDAAREAYLGLDTPRVLVGASMGGLLAIMLAAERAPAALVLLAPALKFAGPGAAFLKVLAAGAARAGWAIPKGSPGGDLGDPEARRKNPTYPSLPTLGLASVERLRLRALEVLEGVRCPTFVAHGTGDQTVDMEASDIAVAGLRASHVERHTFPRSRHILGVDADRDELARAIVRFCEGALVDRA